MKTGFIVSSASSRDYVFPSPLPPKATPPTYLYQTPSGYIFRLRVPLDLKPLIGKGEFRFSLGTGSLREAKHRARLLASHIHQLFIEVRTEDISQQTVSAQQVKPAQDTETGKAINQSIKGYLCRIRASSQRVNNSPRVTDSPRDSTPEPQGQQTDTPASSVPAQQVEQVIPAKPVLLFSELQKLYTDEMRKGDNWTEKTYDENLKVFALFVRAMGDLPISTIERKTVSTYKTILSQLPPNLNVLPRYKDKSLEEAIASKPEKTLSTSSINKQIHWLSGLFNYAVNNGHIPFNPATGMLVKTAKRPDQQREIYTKEDLNSLFGSAEHRKATNHEYWVPLIGLYSGCRLEEICQLHLADIREQDGVWIFDINDQQEKRLKNINSVRYVPIHPKLIELGLIEYANRLKAKGEERLFPMLHQRRDGYGQVISKWFSRFKNRRGISRGKTFHSFRHTFITNLKHAGVDPFMIHELDGHAIASETMGRYGKRYTAEILLREAVLKLDYGI